MKPTYNEEGEPTGPDAFMQAVCNQCGAEARFSVYKGDVPGQDPLDEVNELSASWLLRHSCHRRERPDEA